MLGGTEEISDAIDAPILTANGGSQLRAPLLAARSRVIHAQIHSCPDIRAPPPAGLSPTLRGPTRPPAPRGDGARRAARRPPGSLARLPPPSAGREEDRSGVAAPRRPRGRPLGQGGGGVDADWTSQRAAVGHGFRRCGLAGGADRAGVGCAADA